MARVLNARNGTYKETTQNMDLTRVHACTRLGCQHQVQDLSCRPPRQAMLAIANEASFSLQASIWINLDNGFGAPKRRGYVVCIINSLEFEIKIFTLNLTKTREPGYKCEMTVLRSAFLGHILFWVLGYDGTGWPMAGQPVPPAVQPAGTSYSRSRPPHWPTRVPLLAEKRFRRWRPFSRPQWLISLLVRVAG